MTTPLISAQWLNNNLNDPNLVILDASQQLAENNIQISGARYFDVKNVFSEQQSEFPNTFPSVQQFEEECQKLGINNSSKIVVYDNEGIFYSPRVWWMFKTMGYQNVAVLDGGLPEWIAQGYKTVTGHYTEFTPGNFKANFKKEQVKAYDFVRANITSKNALVIDARSAGRFNGTVPDPREGLKSGSIPNSINLHYATVLENGKFKSKAALTALFSEIHHQKKPLVFTCGSGITACIILLASELVMEQETAVYDGSWTEWATLQK